MPEDEPDDPTLIHRMRGGDEAAFLELYRRRHPGVYRFARQMSGSGAIAEEATQEAFVALVREAERYDASRGTVTAFLFGIARNHVLRLRRGRPLAARADVPDVADESVDALGHLLQAERVAAVRRAIRSLPDHYREVVLLCDIEGLEYRDAALALECPVGTVRSRLARGRELLARKMRDRRLDAVAVDALRSVRCTP